MNLPGQCGIGAAVRVGLVFGVIVLGLPWPALGCSCVEARKTRRVLPADGATDVPTNALIRVFLRDFLPELRQQMGVEYRLLDAEGLRVEVDSEVVGTRVDLSPQRPLEPASRYTLEQIFAYDPAGLRLTDTERWEASMDPQGPTLRGRWYPVVSFTTGREAAASEEQGGDGSSPEPRQRRPMDAEFHFAVDGVCIWGPWLSARFDRPVGASDTDVLELRAEGLGTLVTAPANGPSTQDEIHLFAGSSACGPDPVAVGFEPPLRARVAIVDLSGAEVGGTEWRDVAGPPEPVERPASERTAEERAGIERWSQLRIEAGEVAALEGAEGGKAKVPRACPFGFESESRPVRSTSIVSPFGLQTLPPTSDGRTAWTTVTDREGVVELLALGAGGWTSSIRTAFRGYPQDSSWGPDGLVLTGIDRGDGEDITASLVSLDPGDGRLGWSQPLFAKGLEYRVARGGGMVLVVSQVYTPESDTWLTWSAFDSESGELLEWSPQRGVETYDAEGPDVVFVDDRFLVSWASERGGRKEPVRTLVVRPDGATEPVREIAVLGNGIPSLAVADESVGLATVADGLVQWSRLDADGAIELGPVTVSAGVGGRDSVNPRLAWNGSLFAVVWASHPGVFAAAIDASGYVSPAVRLDSGESYSGDVGVAAVGDEFVASWSVDFREPRFATLRCRSAPEDGAPQRISPLPIPPTL